MRLEGALSGWRQHSQARQEELGILLVTGEHQRSPPMPLQGVGWGYHSPGAVSDGARGSGCGIIPWEHLVLQLLSGSRRWVLGCGGSLRRHLDTRGEGEGEGWWRLDASAPQ